MNMKILSILFFLILLSRLTVAQVFNYAADPTHIPAYTTIAASGASSTSTLNIPYPTTVVKGQIIILAIAYKYSGATVTPTGFTSIASLASALGGGTGEDLGDPVIHVYYKIADGTEGGTNFSTTFSSGSAITGRTFLLTKDSRYNWSILSASGTDNTSGTGYSITTSSNLILKKGDVILACSATTVQTVGFGTGTLTHSGSTFATLLKPQDTGTSAGFNVRLGVQHSTVLTSSGTNAAMTFASTLSGSSWGPTVIVVLRQTL